MAAGADQGHHEPLSVGAGTREDVPVGPRHLGREIRTAAALLHPVAISAHERGLDAIKRPPHVHQAGNPEACDVGV